MYQLTINAPEEKGWTHEHILGVMRGNFKTLALMLSGAEISVLLSANYLQNT